MALREYMQHLIRTKSVHASDIRVLNDDSTAFLESSLFLDSRHQDEQGNQISDNGNDSSLSSFSSSSLPSDFFVGDASSDDIEWKHRKLRKTSSQNFTMQLTSPQQFYLGPNNNTTPTQSTPRSSPSTMIPASSSSLKRKISRIQSYHDSNHYHEQCPYQHNYPMECPVK